MDEPGEFLRRKLRCLADVTGDLVLPHVGPFMPQHAATDTLICLNVVILPKNSPALGSVDLRKLPLSDSLCHRFT